MTDTPPPRYERTRERSPGILILFAYSDALIALEAAEEAGEHPNSLFHLRRAVDALELAHRQLSNRDGTAIVKPGEAKPVDDTRTPLPYPTTGGRP